MTDISKYFWNLNKEALRQIQKILNDPGHPKFAVHMVTLLSRCDQPRELFSLTSKEKFIRNWPKIRSYWTRVVRESDFRDWWQTIYEQILQKQGAKYKIPKGKSSVLFSRVGRMIKEARIQNDLSQNELALKTGMKQPDISLIEEGKKNITLETLMRLCKALDIKEIDLL